MLQRKPPYQRLSYKLGMLPLRARWWWHKVWLVRAWRDSPASRRCGWCGRYNWFCDDVGYFHTAPFKVRGDEDERPTCRHCFDNWAGAMHRARWGEGDR
jgi:hypothetical protein